VLHGPEPPDPAHRAGQRGLRLDQMQLIQQRDCETQDDEDEDDYCEL